MKLNDLLDKFEFTASELALRPSLTTATEVYSGLLHQREAIKKINKEDGAIPIELANSYLSNLSISRILMRNLKNECSKSNYLYTLISLMDESTKDFVFY